MRFYFTFGQGHHDKNHATLSNYYVVIDADTEQQARIEMSAKRGDKWSSCYDDTKIVEKYKLTPMWFQHLTPQEGPTK